VTILLCLALGFPGTRIANLPAGPVLDNGAWQLSISHRFLSAEDNNQLGSALNFLKDANVRFAVERGLPADLTAGMSYGNNYELGVNCSWAPLDHLTGGAGMGINLIERTLATTWLNAAVAGHMTPLPQVHLVALPRLTTNTIDTYLSLGLGVKAGLPSGFSLGFETEPALFGPEPSSGSRLLAWSFALDKELGWHNFTLVLGNAWHQSVPYWFAAANRNITKGHFRAGFNILRKL
jgi:hypothetical protein